MIDRGFIKWQPFNSVISNKSIIESISTNKKINKPILFPEEKESLNNKIIEAYYAKNIINITFYEENKIKTLNTSISKINPSTNTLELSNHKIISFNQILKII